MPHARARVITFHVITAKKIKTAMALPPRRFDTARIAVSDDVQLCYHLARRDEQAHTQAQSGFPVDGEDKASIRKTGNK